MIFNSITYVVFLIIIVSLYWILPTRPRLWLLFFSGLIFYGFWRVEYIPIMLFQITTDFTMSLLISRTTDLRRRKIFLAITLALNLGLLAYFKYTIFFLKNAVGILNLMGFDVHVTLPTILLPLGISFYTFHSISYTIDVYRGFIRPERNFILMATFVSFFPQLVAGPILRAREVMPQLKHRRKLDWICLFIGVRRILYGMFLKVVLADNIAPLVDSGFYEKVSSLGALDIWTLAFLFGFQIYFDFSAYSHIAIGTALLMGIRFPENFNFPYMSVSPREFWRRWHISLSSWVRDYLYLPLTGAALQDRSTGGLGSAVDGEAKRSTTRALFITWAVMGFWHGANWTFVVWGLYHAALVFLYRVCERVFGEVTTWRRQVAGWLITLPLIMLGWVFFRAETLGGALEMVVKVLDPFAYSIMGLRESTYLVTALLLLAVILAYYIETWANSRFESYRIAWSFGESVILGTVMTLVFVFFRPISQFIYFQF